MTKAGWAAILGLNVLLLPLLYYGFLYLTDSYIEAQKSVTLIYDNHALRRQVMLPDQSYQTFGKRIEINSLGLRGALPLSPKPDSLCRLVVMGGSAAYDIYAGDGESWPEILKNTLKASGHENIEVINAGVSGYSARETLAFYHDVIRFLDPDAVLFYHGWNDLKYVKAFRNTINVDAFFYVKEWRDQYEFLTADRPRRNFLALMRLLENVGSPGSPFANEAKAESPGVVGGRPSTDEIRIGPDSPGMSYWRKNVEAFVIAALSDGVMPILIAQNQLASPLNGERERNKIGYHFVGLGHDAMVSANEMMVDVVRRTADQFAVPFIDLRPEIAGTLDTMADHVHFRAAGSAAFGKALAGSLKTVLKDTGCLRMEPPQVLAVFQARRPPAADPARDRVSLLEQAFAGPVGDFLETWQVRGGRITEVRRSSSGGLEILPGDAANYVKTVLTTDALTPGTMVLATVEISGSKPGVCSLLVMMPTTYGWRRHVAVHYGEAGLNETVAVAAPVPTTLTRPELHLFLQKLAPSALCRFRNLSLSAGDEAA